MTPVNRKQAPHLAKRPQQRINIRQTSTRTSSPSNAKVLKISAGVFERRRNVFNASRTWAFMDGIQQIVKGRARTFCFEADRTIGFVANPACATERLCALGREMAKTDTLHTPRDSR